ncbi:hypothetical protein [Xanthobacter autotrophicus]|uniref:hypothetical protein n=1 Tax=Xanthobacter autotrophicus TaxID=280 RepID=UPI003728CF98
MATKATGKPKRSSESRLKERQGLLLLTLLAHPDGAAAQKDLRPSPDPGVRRPLERDGWIRTVKRGRGNVIEVTDKGWDAGGTALQALLPEDADGAAAVLRAVLVRLDAFMATREVALSDLLGPQSGALPVPSSAVAGAPEAEEAGEGVDLRARIRAAYLAVTGGRLNTRALLKTLRPHLPDVPADALDTALKAMQADGTARLYRIDNRVEMTDLDRAAAVQIAGEPRHILWIER